MGATTETVDIAERVSLSDHSNFDLFNVCLIELRSMSILKIVCRIDLCVEERLYACLKLGPHVLMRRYLTEATLN